MTVAVGARNLFKVDAGVVHTLLQARYYDGSKGAFLSEDPVFLGDPKSQVLTDPQSLNSYSYANDNPITKSDPSGLTVADVFVGFGNAYGSNLALGAGRVDANYYTGNQRDYQFGQAVGDIAGMVTGALGVVGGNAV